MLHNTIVFFGSQKSDDTNSSYFQFSIPSPRSSMVQHNPISQTKLTKSKMPAITPPSDTNTEDAFSSLFSKLSTIKTSTDAAKSAEASRKLLESKLDGPSGVISSLLPRVWLPSLPKDPDQITSPSPSGKVQGDDALSILTYLVEAHPSTYMSLTARAVRHDIELHCRTNTSCGTNNTTQEKQITDALLLSLAKLLVAPNSDTQVGIASDAHAALLSLCQWDHKQQTSSTHHNALAKRILSTLIMLWNHLHQQPKQKQRESSTSEMRIAALMIDICLIGNEEMALALDGPDCIMDKLLHLALDHPNDDPLLQMSALDQLERLAVHDSKTPMSLKRAEFLLSNDELRKGLLFLVGFDSESEGASNEECDMDPINGGAALRLLTEICRVGVSTTTSDSFSNRQDTWDKFQALLQRFQKALHNFHPRGELERLSYIYAASSLVSSCAIVASSSASSSSSKEISSAILQDTTLLHEWLSLHSRASQPKLKSAVLCSFAQVMEPTLWSADIAGEGDTISLTANNSHAATDLDLCTRPNDAIVLQLYQLFSNANNDRDSTELILTSAKSPFVEERLGAYSVLRALVMRGVGVRMLLLYDGANTSSGDGFLEWLLQQKNENTSEGKQAKYEIVDAMLSCNSDFIRGLLSEKVFRELELWRGRGPNFVKAVKWEMATE